MEPRSEPKSSNDGYAALHGAAACGDTEAVRKCLEGGTNPNAEDESGHTALHRVLTAEAARALLDGGANIEARDKWGWTPLSNAAFFGRDKVFEALLAAGASVTTRTETGRTLLHFAHSEDAARALIRAGAPIDTPDKRGILPLHIAVCSCKEGIVEALISAGAKPDAAMNDGNTSLHLVQDSSTAEVLVKAGASVNLVDLKGQTPLHTAVAKGRFYVSEVLLAAGASLEVKDKRRMTPMAYALFDEAEGASVGLCSTRMSSMLEREVSLVAWRRYTPSQSGCTPSAVLEMSRVSCRQKLGARGGPLCGRHGLERWPKHLPSRNPRTRDTPERRKGRRRVKILVFAVSANSFLGEFRGTTSASASVRSRALPLSPFLVVSQFISCHVKIQKQLCNVLASFFQSQLRWG